MDRLLRRWVQELAAFLGTQNPLADLDQEAASAGEGGLGQTVTRSTSERCRGEPTGPQKPISARIEETFASLLHQAAARTRVVILLDALNQFEITTCAQYLTWLPKRWPDNARLVATALRGPASQALRQRAGTLAQAVCDLDEFEARQIADRFARQRYHHDVNPQALRTLLAKRLPDDRPAHANPLWLQLAVEELNLLEADDFEEAERLFAHLPGPERMQALLARMAESLPADVPRVYGGFADRAEKHFGRQWTQSVVNAIAVSRAGWREDDLRAMVPSVSGLEWDDLTFAGLRRALGSHLVRRGVHAQWDFFHAQLRQTVVAEYILDGLAEPGNPRLQWILSLLDEPSLTAREQASLCSQYTWGLLNALKNNARITARLEVVRRTNITLQKLCQQEPGDAAWQYELSVSHAELAGLLIAQGDLTGALSAYRASLAIVEPLAAADPGDFELQHEHLRLQMEMSDTFKAQGDRAAAISACRAGLKVSERLAADHPRSDVSAQTHLLFHDRLGDLLLEQGDVADPGNAQWQCCLSITLSKLGEVFKAQGDAVEAVRYCRRAQQIAQAISSKHPENIELRCLTSQVRGLVLEAWLSSRPARLCFTMVAIALLYGAWWLFGRSAWFSPISVLMVFFAISGLFIKIRE